MGLGRYRLGQSDGRRTARPQLLSGLAQAPFTQAQKAMLSARAYAVDVAPPYIHPNLSFFNPPTDSDSFTVTPVPSVAYPAVGASAVVVISFAVPRSKMALIRKMAIVHIGGNPPDFTGQVIWRVLKNGAGLRGLNQLTAQFGTMAAPKDVNLLGVENDTIIVTAECPALLPDGVTPNPGPSVGSKTAASFDGFMYPLSEAMMPVQGSY